MMKRINNIVIVGGGTASWLTAAYLSNNNNINITVIDKEIGNPVGVGEATLLNFKDFLDACNLPIEDWFNKVSATFKAGIIFPDWVEKGTNIWHPFNMNYDMGGVSKYDLWANNQDLDFKKYATGLYDLSVENNKLNLNQKYAFHVDCGKLVVYIQNVLKNRITFINSEVVTIDRDNNENIKSVNLKNGQTVEGDLFVDCTGWLQLLKNKPIRNNLDNRLICDTAIACRVDEQDIVPYAVCTAKEFGWTWRIPTQERIGTGYVFNKSLLSIDNAKLELNKHTNGAAKLENMRVLNWEPFYNENFWHENVVSIGLSAGFIEPLESTGIALIMEGIFQLSTLIQNNSYSKDKVNIYNSIMKEFFEESIDFVGSHYTLTKRTEPFWQEVKSYIKISDKQQYYMEMLKDPNKNISYYGNSHSFFTDNNWTTWLIQMGCEVSKKNINLNKDVARHLLETENFKNSIQNPIFGVDSKEYTKYLNKVYIN
jgi:flavin-dependent dehydrogenase